MTGSVAAPGHAVDLHGAKQVEANRDLGAAFRGNRNERRERDHRVGGAAAHVDVTDIFGLAAVVGLGLHVDTEQTAETVEVIYVAAAHACGQGLKDLVDRHTELTRLLAVEVYLYLRIAGIEGSEEIGQFGPLSRCLEKLAGVVAELLHSERAATVLQQKIKTGRRAKAGDCRNVERKDDRLGNVRHLPLQVSHDAAHMERVGMPLFPRLHTDENRAEVGLIGARYHAVAANGRERVDPFGFGQDLLDL